MGSQTLFIAAVPGETREIFRVLQGQELRKAPFRLERLLDPGPKASESPRESWILTTGIGAAAAGAATAWALGQVSAKRIVNVGSAGSFDLEKLPLEAVALVESDRFGDLGTQLETGPWIDGADLGIGPPPRGENLFPFVSSSPEPGEANPSFDFPLIRAHAVTVSHVAGTPRDRDSRKERTGALLESMEGAAIAMVAEIFGIPCLQFRGISNLAGGPRGGWKFQAANRNAQLAALGWIRSLPESP